MMSSQQSQYDRAITVFSPEGKLYQVQYAREAVKKGSSAVGVKSKEGIVLAVEIRTESELVEPESYEKIYQIDEHIAAASSGMVADSRALIDEARESAQSHRVTYGEAMHTPILVKKVADHKQQFTQYGGVRPFGVSLLIGGINDEPHLYKTDPSGAYYKWKAAAIGSGKDKANNVLEENYDSVEGLSDSIDLALKALRKVMNEEITSKNVEVAQIPLETKLFERLTPEKLQDHIESLDSE